MIGLLSGAAPSLPVDDASVIQAVRLAAANGVDIRLRALRFLAAMGSQRALALRAAGVEEALIDERIDEIYCELARIDAGPPTQESDPVRRRLVEELRALQEDEARSFARRFDRERPLPRGAGYDALRQAEGLLERRAPSPAKE